MAARVERPRGGFFFAAAATGLRSAGERVAGSAVGPRKRSRLTWTCPSSSTSTGASWPAAACAVPAGTSTTAAAAAAVRRRLIRVLTTSSGDVALHHEVGADVRRLELVRGHDKARPLVEGACGRPGVAPHARGALVAGVGDKRLQHRSSGALTARFRHRRHSADAPGSGLALGHDESNRYKWPAREGADRERANGLVCRELFERLVRAQDRLPECACVGDRYFADRNFR